MSLANTVEEHFKPLRQFTEDGGLVLNFHEGQMAAFQSPARFIAMIAGTGGGKTSFGPHWLWNEIGLRGHGDYLMVAPSYKLMDKKALPEFLEVFQTYGKVGKFAKGEAIFEFSEEGMAYMHGFDEETNQPRFELHRPTKVFFGHADDPNSLESAMAKGAWLDEPGQKRFRLDSWEAIQRRVGLYQGRVLLTTTPYDLGWLYKEVYLRWQDGDPDYDVINFASTMNPMYSPLELERARRTLPDWKFKMFYLGIFTRPAGLIYDCFSKKNVCAPFQIPHDWVRVIGIDFGGVNNAAGYYAMPPNFWQLPEGSPYRRYYKYREYFPRVYRTAADHTREILRGEPKNVRVLAVGGAPSETQQRLEFKAGGLRVRKPPVSDLWVGIDRCYAALKLGECVFFDTCKYTLDQVESYSREVDERGEPVDGTIEAKETYHLLDEWRYANSYIKRRGGTWTPEDFARINPDSAFAEPPRKYPNYHVTDEEYQEHLEKEPPRGYSPLGPPSDRDIY